MSMVLSGVAPSVREVINPWRLLRDLAHIELRWHEGGPMGRTFHAEQVISLRRGMTWEERRCTVQHELLHVERGPQPRGLRAKDEETVRRETARLMLPDVKVVAEALAWAHNLDEAAEELGVDTYVLRKRLRHLHPAERAWLHRRFEEVD